MSRPPPLAWLATVRPATDAIKSEGGKVEAIKRQADHA